MQGDLLPGDLDPKIRAGKLEMGKTSVPPHPQAFAVDSLPILRSIAVMNTFSRFDFPPGRPLFFRKIDPGKTHHTNLTRGTP